MAIQMLGYILALIFPIYVNIFQRDTMDAHRKTALNVDVPVGKEIEMKRADAEQVERVHRNN
jgi:FHS family L-fucose permease-like MFS transporter